MNIGSTVFPIKRLFRLVDPFENTWSMKEFNVVSLPIGDISSPSRRDGYPDIFLRFRVVVPVFAPQHLKMRTVFQPVGGSG